MKVGAQVDNEGVESIVNGWGTHDLVRVDVWDNPRVE